MFKKDSTDLSSPIMRRSIIIIFFKTFYAVVKKTIPGSTALL